MNNDELTLVLPLPPTINHFYGQHGKSKFIKLHGQRFISDVAIACQSFQPFQKNQRLSVSIDLFFKTNRACDIDNRIKPMLDALQKAGLIPNDSQVDDLFVSRNKAKSEYSIVSIRGN